MTRLRTCSLRVRLVIGTVVVLTLGLAAVDVFSYVWLRQDLVRRVDSQLRELVDGPDGGRDPGGPAGRNLALGGPPGQSPAGGPTAAPAASVLPGNPPAPAPAGSRPAGGRGTGSGGTGTTAAGSSRAGPVSGGSVPALPPDDPGAGARGTPDPGERLDSTAVELPIRTDVQKYHLSRTGEVIDKVVNPDSRASPPRLTADLIDAVGQDPQTVRSVSGDASWRIKVRAEGPNGYEVVAISMAETEDTTRNLITIEILVTLAATIVLAAFSLAITRIGLRPLTRMQRIAEQITADDLSTRLPDAGVTTETGRLAIAFNTMLTRIESAVEAQRASEERLRRFVADASHELRTPLTSIRGFAELHRVSEEFHGRPDQLARRIEDEARRMGVLVEDLLLLAQLDAQRPLNKTPVDLLELAADAAQAAHAQDLSRSIVLEGAEPGWPPEPVTVIADEHRLRQVIGNLVANALRHTPSGSPLALRVGVPRGGDPPERPVATVGQLRTAPVAVLEVVDCGPGVPQDQAAHLFERFWRADPARARVHGGVGLGLAIVAAIVNGHRGRVELYTAPGRGCRFRVLLPEA